MELNSSLPPSSHIISRLWILRKSLKMIFKRTQYGLITELLLQWYCRAVLINWVFSYYLTFTQSIHFIYFTLIITWYGPLISSDFLSHSTLSKQYWSVVNSCIVVVFYMWQHQSRIITFLLFRRNDPWKKECNTSSMIVVCKTILCEQNFLSETEIWSLLGKWYTQSTHGVVIFKENKKSNQRKSLP